MLFGCEKILIEICLVFDEVIEKWGVCIECVEVVDINLLKDV